MLYNHCNGKLIINQFPYETLHLTMYNKYVRHEVYYQYFQLSQ